MEQRDYRDRCQNVAQEMEGNYATADLMAWPGSAWLQLSFSPFPVRHPVDGHGATDVPNKRNILI